MSEGVGGVHTSTRLFPCARAHVEKVRVDPPPRLHPSSNVTLPDTLDALAARVARLHQGHRDPEAFYEQRSEIAGELRRLARHWKSTGERNA